MIKRIAMTLGTFLFFSAAAFNASAGGLSVQAASGFPYQNNSWGNYTFSDGTVSFSNRAWAVNIPVDPSGQTYSVNEWCSSVTEASAWVFSASGGVLGYYPISLMGGTCYAGTNVPVPAANNVLMIRFTAGSTTAKVYSASASY
jgi:hypothetical protein